MGLIAGARHPGRSVAGRPGGGGGADHPRRARGLQRLSRVPGVADHRARVDAGQRPPRASRRWRGSPRSCDGAGPSAAADAGGGPTRRRTRGPRAARSRAAIEFAAASTLRATTGRPDPRAAGAARSVVSRAPRGAIVAVVGPTGGGKSTLGRAAGAGSSSRRAGAIFVDGVDVRDIPLGALRRAVGYVPQEPFLFSRSLRDNLRARRRRRRRRGAGAARWPTAGLADEVGRAARGLGHRGRRARAHAVGRPAPARGPGPRARWPIRAILVLDDPFASVDPDKEAEILGRAARGAAAGGRRSSSRTGCARAPRRTGSWCSPTGAWWSRGRHGDLAGARAASTRGSGGSSRSRTSLSGPSPDEDAVRRRAPTTPAHAAAVGADAPARPARAAPSLAAVPAGGVGGAAPAVPAQGRHRRPHPARDWAGLADMAAAVPRLAGRALRAPRCRRPTSCTLTGQRVIHDLRQPLFAHLQRMDAAFFDRNPVGRLMTRVLNDVEAINEMFVSGVVVVVGDVVTLLGVVADHAVDGLAARPRAPSRSCPCWWSAAGTSGCGRATSYRRGADAPRPPQRVPPGVAPGHDGHPALRPRAGGGAAASRGLNADLRAAQFRSTWFESALYAAVEAHRARRPSRCSSGTGAGRSWPARSRSARWPRSSSTPRGSSCRCATSARSTR